MKWIFLTFCFLPDISARVLYEVIEALNTTITNITYRYETCLPGAYAHFYANGTNVCLPCPPGDFCPGGQAVTTTDGTGMSANIGDFPAPCTEYCSNLAGSLFSLGTYSTPCSGLVSTEFTGQNVGFCTFANAPNNLCTSQPGGANWTLIKALNVYSGPNGTGFEKYVGALCQPSTCLSGYHFAVAAGGQGNVCVATPSSPPPILACPANNFCLGGVATTCKVCNVSASAVHQSNYGVSGKSCLATRDTSCISPTAFHSETKQITNAVVQLQSLVPLSAQYNTVLSIIHQLQDAYNVTSATLLPS